MELTKQNFYFLPLYDKLVSEKEEYLQLKLEDGNLTAYTVTSQATAICEQIIDNATDESFNVVVQTKKLLTFLASLKDKSFDVSQVVVDSEEKPALRITFNNGKSSHIIEGEIKEFPSKEEFLSVVNGEPEGSYIFTDLKPYKLLEPFVASLASPSTSNFATVVNEDNWMIGIKNTKQFAFVKTENKIKDVSINRIFFDLATRFDETSLEVKTFPKMDYGRVQDIDIFIAKKDFAKFPKFMSGDQIKTKYDHPQYVSFSTEEMIEVMKRFQMIAKDMESQIAVMEFNDGYMIITDQSGLSKEEIQCTCSSQEMIGWHVKFQTMSFSEVVKAIKKGMSRLYVEKDFSNVLVKIENENRDRFFTLRVMGE